MLVNHGLSQQSSEEEYKPWKLGATARYHASHTKTMLPTKKSVPKIQQAIGPHEGLLTIVPFIRFGQNHLARYSEREKKTRKTEEE